MYQEEILILSIGFLVIGVLTFFVLKYTSFVKKTEKAADPVVFDTTPSAEILDLHKTEMSKPRVYIVAITNKGEILRSASFEPTIWYSFVLQKTYVLTSVERATHFVNDLNNFKRFVDRRGVIWLDPVIVKIRVVHTNK